MDVTFVAASYIKLPAKYGDMLLDIRQDCSIPLKLKVYWNNRLNLAIKTRSSHTDVGLVIQ